MVVVAALALEVLRVEDSEAAVVTLLNAVTVGAVVAVAVAAAAAAEEGELISLPACIRKCHPLAFVAKQCFSPTTVEQMVSQQRSIPMLLRLNKPTQRRRAETCRCPTLASCL